MIHGKHHQLRRGKASRVRISRTAPLFSRRRRIQARTTLGSARRADTATAIQRTRLPEGQRLMVHGGHYRLRNSAAHRARTSITAETSSKRKRVLDRTTHVCATCVEIATLLRSRRRVEKERWMIRGDHLGGQLQEIQGLRGAKSRPTKMERRFEKNARISRTAGITWANPNMLSRTDLGFAIRVQAATERQ